MGALEIVLRAAAALAMLLVLPLLVGPVVVGAVVLDVLALLVDVLVSLVDVLVSLVGPEVVLLVPGSVVGPQPRAVAASTSAARSGTRSFVMRIPVRGGQPPRREVRRAKG